MPLRSPVCDLHSACIAVKVARLFKQQQFLKDRGEWILNHDLSVLEQLDEKDPLSAEDL
ncbi:hypothetical protein BO94DRAFT_583782 [Aspergillus sclerotioniger CBS 115572]|uniref:Uncharacterized protein n=1 Tax=Aspergillus sclerotioniger CBS 115572 TaxID=1450535 RepID=A0A317X4H8_9EURO|nr:hypothetical protein BO94DRAFT_583782 [Aspergillus sclerotioniger CBS 115572]PWY91858.1 hypothetical protein BO94DRAFT_583782 [Aspergillus sclerotioniger CBS 115572]